MHFCPFIPGFDCSLNTLHHSTSFKKIQAQACNHIFTQTLIICIVDVGASFGWILLNVIPTPQIVITIVMVSCQFIYDEHEHHTSPSIIYIAMNPNVQQELKKILGMKSGSVQVNTAFTASSAAMTMSMI
ncbi:hypothetical protein PRIPAC_81591 [Pristionchus pacificus]|uniref:G protein-coupled receptor n=1 Tax=Pristionchus pacificus TaxID=54126 RepID=A0A454XWX7_PRIPA|nr:hypothetical protein PRIPAC_81591 [Pristionchus pacificus]|eukprot:PDM79576.1 G protein-coupled receptor [Pristionchus pacificus]